MAVVYSVRDWDHHFECAQSRKVVGPLAWFPLPTKHDGKSFRRIMARMDGPVIYAAWVLICGVAAKCEPVRGRLADADEPYTAADLELKTGMKAELFETALNVLSSKEIGWILGAEWEGSGATGHDSTGQDKDCCAVSGEMPEGASSPASEFVFDTVGKGPKTWTLPQTKLIEYTIAYPGLDVKAEMRAARQWCKDKPRQRKTAGGMQGFLTAWLNRSQNRGGGTKAVDVVGFESVTKEQFAEFVKLKSFKDGPHRNKKTPTWVFGTLRDGRKIECKMYPPPKEAQ